MSDDDIPCIGKRPEEDPVEIAQRKEFFARAARRTIQNNERQRRLRLKQMVIDKSDETLSPWFTGAQKVAYDQAQLEYTKEYKAEYEVKAEPETKKPEQQPSDDNKISSAASCISDGDTVTSLRSVRGKVGFSRRHLASGRSSILEFEQTSTILPPSEMIHEEYTSNVSVADLRKTYFSRYKTNTELPIFNQRSYLINSINSYNVVIIQGATGCGKTTQVPAYILEDAILTGHQSRAPVVYVTQPRRIAARSIAKRVCDEHDWEVGGLVGYQVGLDKIVGPDTVLVFCTAGVLLQKLITEKTLKNYTHIIVDEAHERDADTDLLLMFIRLMMRKEMSYFRLVVMSATMELNKLKEYFTFQTNYGHQAQTTPSIVKIEGKEPQDVQVLYLDKVLSTFKIDIRPPIFDLDQPEVHEECYQAAFKIIMEIIPHLDTFSGATESTLVFLPGLAEITRMHNMLRKAGAEHLDIIPLHSCLSPGDQQRVFLPARPGCRKVILATNIAESSITVKEVGFIIDFCLSKVLRKDKVTNFPALKLQWSTVDKSTQRAGRTGRCCPGKVFRMVSSEFYKQFQAFAAPELLTAPLELSVLRVKNFNMGEVKALLAIVLDPPPINEIRTAVLELKQIGALTSTYNGQITSMDGDLTELGRVISALPIDVHLSKLIVIASVLDVLEDAIIVAACLSTNRSVVKHLYNDQLVSYKCKLRWARGSYSDLFVSLDVFKGYMELKEQNKSASHLLKYCHNRHLDEKKLHEVACLVDELKNRLEAVNIRIFDQPNRVRDVFEDELMLKIAFCASFYPNYFLSEEMDVEEINKSLNGLDPCRTVILHNLPVNQAPLYRPQILQQLREKGIKNDMDYIAESSRAFLVLEEKKKMTNDESSLRAINVDGLIQGSKQVEKALYKILKMPDCLHVHERLHIMQYKEDYAYERLQYYKSQRDHLTTFQRLIPGRLKIVDREPNNREAFEASEEEWAERFNRDYYIEVRANTDLDQEDMAAVTQLRDLIHKTRSQTSAELEFQIDTHMYIAEPKYIRGPTSPIQLSFRSVLEKSKGHKVDIDYMSVNSILLNPDYEKPRRQMLVAAAVNQSKRNRIMACDTTLMPNIRGLPTLMSLLFAQYYRLVYDDSSKYIVGAVFGLGWDEKDQPIDRQYEVELGFDIHVTKEDTELINAARRTISELIRNLDIKDAGAPRAEMQQTLRQILLSVLRRRRFPVDEVTISSINWNNNRFLKEKHNVPENQENIFLPTMEANNRYSEYDMFQAIRENLNHLRDIELGKLMPSQDGERCLLCAKSSLLLLRDKILKHIDSNSHIERLEEFEKAEERARQRHLADEQ